MLSSLFSSPTAALPWDFTSLHLHFKHCYLGRRTREKREKQTNNEGEKYKTVFLLIRNITPLLLNKAIAAGKGRRCCRLPHTDHGSCSTTEKDLLQISPYNWTCIYLTRNRCLSHRHLHPRHPVLMHGEKYLQEEDQSLDEVITLRSTDLCLGKGGKVPALARCCSHPLSFICMDFHSACISSFHSQQFSK